MSNDEIETIVEAYEKAFCKECSKKCNNCKSNLVIKFYIDKSGGKRTKTVSYKCIYR